MLVTKYLDRGREQLGVTTGEIMPDLDSNHTAMDRLYPTSHNASVNINIKGVSVNGSLSVEGSIEKVLARMASAHSRVRVYGQNLGTLTAEQTSVDFPRWSTFD